VKIGVIGTGNMGGGLGRLWARKAHEVFFGSRDARKAQALATSVGYQTRGGSIAEAAAFGDAVLLATPWDGVKVALAAAGPLDGKIDRLHEPARLGGDEARRRLHDLRRRGDRPVGARARVVKAFNTVFGRTLNSSTTGFAGDRATVFFCGDDELANVQVTTLIEELGFEAVAAGPLENARYLEPLGELMVQLAYAEALGTDIALKLLRR
jgi:predicted dinucleotide-binding enzyme